MRFGHHSPASMEDGRRATEDFGTNRIRERDNTRCPITNTLGTGVSRTRQGSGSDTKAHTHGWAILNAGGMQSA